MSRHRGTRLRPRYARMGAAGASLAVTLIAVMGGFGVFPVSSGQANASGDTPTTQQADDPQPTSTDSVVDAPLVGIWTRGPVLALRRGDGEGGRVSHLRDVASRHRA